MTTANGWTTNTWSAQTAALAVSAVTLPALLVVFCPSVFEVLTGEVMTREAAFSAPPAFAATLAYGAIALGASFATLFAIAERLEDGGGRILATRNLMAASFGIGAAAMLVVRMLG